MPKTKKCWSESFGSYGSKIRVAEREPGGILYLLWVDNRGKQQKRSLEHRDKQSGRQVARKLAEQVAGARAAERQTGLLTPVGGGLTLQEGIEIAFDFSAEEAMYPEETRHTRESRRLLDRAVAILGETTAWAELKPRKVRALIRKLAKQSEDGKGARTAELMCDVLYSVAAWLRDEELIPDRAALPGRNWKVKLKQEWEALTGSEVTVARPRHKEEEIGKIFAALPNADPRIELLIETTAWLRAGQGVKCKRTDLDLGKIGGYGLGRLTVGGSGRKKGEVVDLDPELRALVDSVVSTGYLSKAEAAFQRGEIPDYYLFPAGRLVKGRATVENCTKQPLGNKTIRDMFRRLEKDAGVEHVEGRAFYGLRRTGTDVAADLETDDRVLDRLTGHQDSETRKRGYQDRRSDRVLAQAAEVRRAMRGHFEEKGKNAS